MKTEALTCPEAVRRVAQRFGITLPEAAGAGRTREPLTAINTAAAAYFQKELAGLGEVRVLPKMAIVSLVGRGFVHRSGLAARIFQALRECNIIMISFGASDVNLSLVVAEDEAEKAVNALHREFFEGATA